jgi:hypothetical protein
MLQLDGDNMESRRRNLPVFPIVMILAGVLFVISAILWTTNQPSNTVNISPTAPAVQIPYPTVPRLSVDEAKQAFDDGEAIFIDTRGDPYFSQTHIPGALSITEDELPGKIGDFNASDWIITYCT